MGGPNLEVFKFGMYILFPIGIMWHFGTNLNEGDAYAVGSLWPKKEETHQIPFEKSEIEEELERLKARRLASRARRMEIEGQPAGQGAGPSPVLEALQREGGAPAQDVQDSKQSGSWTSWFR